MNTLLEVTITLQLHLNKTINNNFFFLFFEVIKVKVNMVIEINSHVCSQLSVECTKTAVELCF